ncbi:MAG: 50S ribosomal protein L9 [Spartobacteria bacterium]|nr:50S ribosomal protein L9 [Spartobacteria bacterium]
MAVEVILLKDVKGLGCEGQIVHVNEGYARNALFPQKKATLVTPAAKRALDKKKAELEARLLAEKENARQMAKKIEALKCSFPVKVSEDGKMYGSISIPDVVSFLHRSGFEIEKTQLNMPAHLKELGTYEVFVSLGKNITASLSVHIVEE